MARPPRIRLTQNDRAEFARLARNAKAKVRRTFKNYGIDLSGKVDIPDLEQFTSRKQFNEWREKVESFTNRNNLNYQFVKNDYGTVASKKELNQITRDIKKAQRLADEKIKSIEKLPFAQGGTVGQRLPMFGRNNPSGITRPKDFNFGRVRSKSDLDRIAERARQKSTEKYYDQRNWQMRENFKEILGLSFHSDADNLVELVDKIHPDDFYEIYQMHFDIFDFDLYDSEGQQVDAPENAIHQMTTYLEKYLAGEMSLDMKGF